MKRLLAGTMETFTRELSYVKNNNKVFTPNPVKLP